jgi:uncharacterized protein DUF4153
VIAERTAVSVPVQFSIAALAAGLFAGGLVAGNRPGINLLILSVAIAIAVALGRPRAVSADAVVFGALAIALTAIAALRDANWIVGFDLLFAIGLSIVAVTGPQTWTDFIVRPLRAAIRAVFNPFFVLTPLKGQITPEKTRRGVAVARGFLIGTLVVIVFGALFASADRAFSHLLGDFLPNVRLGLLPVRAILFLFVTASTGALVIAGSNYESLDPIWLRNDKVWESIGSDARRFQLSSVEWAIPLALLDLLFAGFVAVQLAALFGGHDLVLRTAGLTYAEYARSGFFQLLVVGFLTLATFAASARWADRSAAPDRRLLKALLGVLFALVMVVLASALRRLGLYEAAFGFTRPRLAGHLITLWLGGVLILMAASGIREKGRWLPRAIIGFTALALLTFSIADPDRLIAERNVQRFVHSGKLDVPYLQSLSADAVPAALDLPPDVRVCLFASQRTHLAKPESWPSANLSRAKARKLLQKLPEAKAVPERCLSD